MDSWITSVVAPIALAVVTWLLGRNGRQIDQTSQIVKLLQNEIVRLNEKIDKVEAKLEDKERELETKSVVIQEAYRCQTPSAKCPVLNKLFECNSKKELSDEQRTEEPQPWKYTSQCDNVSGRDGE